MLSEQYFVKCQQDFDKLLTEFVYSKKVEGLLIKTPNEPYEPGKRRWFKLKRDYLVEEQQQAKTMLRDSLDLLVVGGYYGTNSKGGKVTTFLMGCLDQTTNKVQTITKVSNG